MVGEVGKAIPHCGRGTGIPGFILHEAHDGAVRAQSVPIAQRKPCVAAATSPQLSALLSESPDDEVQGGRQHFFRRGQHRPFCRNSLEKVDCTHFTLRHYSDCKMPDTNLHELLAYKPWKAATRSIQVAGLHANATAR